MNTVKVLLTASAMALPIVFYALPAAAATANNSQAGAMGHTKSMEKSTVMDTAHMRLHHRHRYHHM